MARKIQLEEKDLLQLIQERAPKMSAAAIAAEIGVSASTIERRAKENGIKLNHRADKQRDVVIPKIKMMASRYTPWQIAKEIGISYQTVAKYASESGIVFPKSKPQPNRQLQPEIIKPDFFNVTARGNWLF